MKDVEIMIDELKRFAQDVATLGKPIDPQLISGFEATYNIRLPSDFKYTLGIVNGFSVMGDEVYGIFNENNPSSLQSIYEREHNEVEYPQFSYLVPFSDDGGGNFYCFDTRYSTKDGSSCPVVFWVSNYQYSDSDSPEVVYDNFLDFVNEVLIAWTLRDYDYEGNEK